jgi:hypothetical protein
VIAVLGTSDETFWSNKKFRKEAQDNILKIVDHCLTVFGALLNSIKLSKTPTGSPERDMKNQDKERENSVSLESIIEVVNFSISLL